MAIETGTSLTYDSESLREDLSNAIYNISPTDCPFLTNIGKDKVSQPYFQWQTDVLATANPLNQQLQGGIFVNNTVVATNRVANYTQISTKVAEVSGTYERSVSAGFSSLMSYEMAKMAKELKRDMESSLTSDGNAYVGSSTVPSRSAGLGSWIITNWYDAGTGGSASAPALSAAPNGYPSVSAVNSSSPSVFTSTQLATEIQTVWTQGGEIDRMFIMCGPAQKVTFSTFSGIATRFRDVPPGKQADIVSAADVYVSDFGTINIVPNRFLSGTAANSVYLVDPDLCSVSYLRPFFTQPVPTFSDAKREALLAEYGLRVKNEKGLGIIRNVT